MTDAQIKNVEELMANVEKYSPRLEHIPEPFRYSVAKYYPALKRLAEA